MAQGTPAVDDSIPGVVTVHRPIMLTDTLFVDHHRVIDKEVSGESWTVIIGSLTNSGDEPVELPPFDFDIMIRDRTDIILGSEFVSADYPVIPPGERIGFNSLFINVPFADVDPETIEIVTGGFDSPTGIIEWLAERTLEIESQEEISREGELEIEFVVRNTSDIAFAGLTPNISVWDSNDLYCDSAYANVFTAIPAGDAIRFSTHSAGGTLNPVEIADPDFTWIPWIVPT